MKLSAYKFAYTDYLNFLGSKEHSVIEAIDYIKTLGLQPRIKEAGLISPKYTGTYILSIRFSDEFMTVLEKKKRNYSYPGIANRESGIEKLIEKSFEFIDVFLSKRKYFEQRRNRN